MDKEPDTNRGVVGININTVVTTITSGVVILLISVLLSGSKANAEKLTEIKTSLPYIQASIADMKVSIGQMVTKAEFDSRQKQLADTMESMKTEQERVRMELDKRRVSP